MRNLPLLIFDTNILMDVLLARDGAAVLLVQLAEQQHVDLVVPEYVLFEFRGTAMRWIHSERERLKTIRGAAKEWKRSQELVTPASEIREAVEQIESTLRDLTSKVDRVIERVNTVATVPKHTLELHFRGDLRYLQGFPPDRDEAGLKDCRIYEAILAIVQEDQRIERLKFLVTKDSDFYFPILQQQLKQLGCEIRKDPGRLYAELRPSSR